MKILHVVGSIDKSAGGPSRSVPQTCEFVSKLGVKIELVTRKSEDPVKVNTSENFQLTNHSMLGLILFGFNISSKKVDVIHLQHVWDPYIHLLAWFARVKNIPYIITPRGMLEPWIMNHNPFKKKLGMFLYQKNDLNKANFIHATCQLEYNNIRNLGFKNPIEIIPNGIDLSKVVVSKGTFGSKKMVFMSRIHLKKGIEVLLDAWKSIENNNWELEIAGEGETSYVQQLINKIEIEKIKNVKFVGGKYGEDKWRFITSADVFVLPTYSENFGIVVAESLAVGVPVITTSGTPWEELNSHNCGWCIDLSLEQLKKTIQEAINTPLEELKVMGENGIALVYEKYDVNSVAEKMKVLYEKVVK